ncbi:MAG: ribokinase, partial [Armatimonadetes bacterium]|nr:ribokinase [Armatimonadota bacterium]
AAGTLELDEAALAAMLRFANAAGALATQRIGVIPSLPTQARIEQFLAARPA